jgi:hypothetical protein
LDVGSRLYYNNGMWREGDLAFVLFSYSRLLPLSSKQIFTNCDDSEAALKRRWG